MTTGGMQVLLAVEPLDMRRSFNGIAAAVVARFGRDPKIERTMFVFVSRRGDLVKILWRDASGWCLLAKKFDEKVAMIPRDIPPNTASVVIDGRALTTLLDGVVPRRKETARDIAREARAAAARVRLSSEETQSAPVSS